MVIERPHVTEAELAVLEVLWHAGSATVRQIADDLYEAPNQSLNATVQKLLERLESKRFVRRNRESFAHLYSATIERGDLIDQRIQDMAERLCEGSLTPILVHLVSGKRLKKRDRDMLRKLLDESQE